MSSDKSKELYAKNDPYWMKSRTKSLLSKISDNWRMMAENSDEEKSKELIKKADGLDKEIEALEP